MAKMAVLGAIGIVALAMRVEAQMTGSGAAGAVPVFTSTSSIGNSGIWALPNGNIGIGNQNPSGPLTVNAGNYAVEIGQFTAGPRANPGLRSDGAGNLDLSSGSSGELSFGYDNSTRFTFWGAWKNGAPSLAYESAASFLFNAAGVELAEGIDVSGPYSFWMQTRNNFGGPQNLAINPLGGAVGIGTTNPGASLEVNGNVKLTANSGASITFQDGTSQTTAWTGVLCGGDYAEAVDVANDRRHYAPGDVLVIASGNSSDVEKSSAPYSKMVAGVYATRPGTIGRRQSLPQSASEIPMAMVGIVPTKVTAENGSIRKGDLLVTSSKPGEAMKGIDSSRMLGAIIGKAMGPLNSGTGVIEVLVTLQ